MHTIVRKLLPFKEKSTDYRFGAHSPGVDINHFVSDISPQLERKIRLCLKHYFWENQFSQWWLLYIQARDDAGTRGTGLWIITACKLCMTEVFSFLHHVSSRSLTVCTVLHDHWRPTLCCVMSYCILRWDRCPWPAKILFKRLCKNDNLHGCVTM